METVEDLDVATDAHVMNKVEKFTNWCQGHKIVSLLIIFGVIIIALGTVAESLDKLTGFFAHHKPIGSLTQKKNEITAEDILTEIKAARPFQKKDVARSYEGAIVDWKLPLLSVNDQDGGMTQLLFKSSGGLFAAGGVALALPTKDLGGVKLLPAGALIHIRGTIEKVSDQPLGSIYLKNGSLVQ